MSPQLPHRGMARLLVNSDSKIHPSLPAIAGIVILAEHAKSLSRSE
jgi:hypothetical protein